MDHAHHGSGDLALELPLLFLTGLTVSLGHCLGMCGPLQSAVVIRWRETRTGSLWPRLLRYHLARITSYVLIGGIFALLGTATLLTGNAATWQGVLSVAAAVLMVPVSLALLGILPASRWTELRGVGDWFTRRFLARGGGGTRGDWALGMLNGFLPCGPVLAVALTAATKSLGMGVAHMAVYGAGTLPVLLLWGAALTRLSSRVRLGFHRLSGALLLVISVQLALRGLAALGAIRHLDLGPFMLW